MTTLPAWLRTVTAGGVDLLATQLLYSMILAAMVMVCLRLFRVRSPAVHQAAWSLVLLRLFLPPGWATPLSLRSLLDRLLGPTDGTRAILAAPAPAEVALQASSTAGGGGALAAMAWWQPLVVGLWVIGAGALAAMIWVRLRRYRRVIRRAAAVEDDRIVALAEAWRRRLGIRRPVRVVASGAGLSPFTTGLVAPVIFLPEAVLTWPTPSLESILAHEMVHVRRWDELWIGLGNLLRTVHFFNPAAWLAIIELGQAREQLCDETVLAQGVVDAKDYCRSLVNVMRLDHSGPTAVDALVGLVDRKEGIKMRVVTIHSDRRSRQPRPLWLLLGATLCTLFVLPMAPYFPAPEAAPELVGRVDFSGEGGTISIFSSEAEEGLVPPVRLSGPIPEYPARALESGDTGMVMLSATVATDGRVVAVEVQRPISDDLTEAAVAAVWQWRYRPALVDGEPVERAIDVVLHFHLEPAAEIDPALLAALDGVLPAGVEITSLVADGASVDMKGVADGGHLVAQLLARLGDSPAVGGEANLRSMKLEEGHTRFHITFPAAR